MASRQTFQFVSKIKSVGQTIAALFKRLFQKSTSYFARKTFLLWQALGLHVVPNHFYQPIPDTRTLSDNLWKKHSKLVGLNMNEQVQLKLFKEFIVKFKAEYDRFPLNQISLPYEYYVNNRTYESVDGEILYCMVRHFKPKKIIEIGVGNSTYAIAQAIRKNKAENETNACEFTAIDPFPNHIVSKGFAGLSKLLIQPVQNIPISKFKELSENDILNIDSSHVIKLGNDVHYEFLEILPQLNKGVIVGFHDIFLPAEYPKEWVLKYHIFWNEQYLLQTFLMFNDSWKVLWGSSFMHFNYPQELEKAFNSYDQHQRSPGSFWIRRFR
jgi:hypothetical protein